MKNYLFLDVETGGIGLDKSLLSIGIVVSDDRFNTIESKSFFVKPNDGVYNVTSVALDINKINLVDHDKKATTYKETGKILYEFLNKYCKNEKIIVFGKNVNFDLSHIWDKILSRNTWEQFCSYQTVDLTSVWKFLEITRRVPVLDKTSLSDLAKYLQINFDTNNLHNELFDAELTRQCFNKISEI